MAFVEKQLVPVQFGGGVNTKADPKQLQAGQLLALQNGQFSKQGQINKRFGYDALSRNIEGGGTITSGVELATFKDELLLFDGTNVYSYLRATGNWASRGVAISVTTADKTVIRTSQAQQLNPDMAYAAGIEVYAWEDSRGGVRYSVLDTNAGAFVVTDTAVALAGAQQPKLVTMAGTIYLFYVVAKSLVYQKIGPLNPTVIQAPITAITDGYGDGINFFPYDIFVSGTKIFVGYFRQQAALVFAQTFTIDTNDIVANQQNWQGITAPLNHHGAVNIYQDAGLTLWFSWADGVHVWTGSQTLFQQGFTVTQIDSGVCTAIASIADYASGKLRLFYELVGSGSLSYNEKTKFLVIDTAGNLTSSGTLSSVGLASKPWTFGGKLFVGTAYQSTLQATDFTWYIPSTGSPVIVAKETASVGGGLITNGMVAETVNLAYGEYKFANTMAGKLTSEANTLFSLLGVNSTALVFSPSDNFLNTTLANTLLIVGGVLQGYDGVSVTELGFHLYPENVTATAQGSGGNLTAGVVQYQVQFEWTDNSGQIYRSAPSVAQSVTVVNSDSVIVTGPSLRLTGKTKVSVVIYRTQANGVIFRRVTSTLAPLLNDPTADTWTFTDTLSDAASAANEVNYTTGGILSNVAPPANSLITTYGNRAVLSGMSDRLLSWYSQEVVDNAGTNTIPPQFCQELTIACDPRGGNITALGLLNQTLVLFKASHIFVLSGNGPDATGSNNDFGNPTLISSEIGCINSNSVVITSLGLFFLSARGIYLLDQALNLTYIGAAVEAFNGLNITASVENGQDNQVIFVSSDGTALVYDHYFHQWSTWTNHPAQDVVIFQNKVCFIRSDGQVWLQNRSKFTDGPTPVYLSWTLPNLSFAGIQGFARVFRCYILGTYKGPHKLLVGVAYDFEDGYSQTATVVPNQVVETWGSDVAWGAGQGWGLPDVWGGGGGSIYEFRIDFARQKCTSIRLQVQDSQTSNYNEGYSISSVVFEVGALPGGNRLPASATYGSN